MSLPSWSTESRSTVLPSRRWDLAEPVPRSQLCNTQQGVYFLCRKLSHLLPTRPRPSLSHTHIPQLESLNEKKEGSVCVKYQQSAQSIMWVWLSGSCGAAECPDFSPHKLPHYFPWPFLCCSVAAVGREPTAQPLWQYSVLRGLWSILDVSKHTVSLPNCSLFIRNQCMVEKF